MFFFASIFRRADHTTHSSLRCVVEVFSPSRQWCVGWIVGQELTPFFRGKTGTSDKPQGGVDDQLR